MTQLRVLQHEYVFDNRLAKCTSCELASQLNTMCLAQRPANWNGLMVVGEGPNVSEGRLKTPFVGKAGQILDALLAQSGLRREETFVTNATLCVPTRYEGAFDEAFPHAVPSCRPRLLEEIAHYQPRVIVALGRAALLSMTGREIQKTKREKIECRTCSGALTLPWYPCVDCKAQVPFREDMPLFNCPACSAPGGGATTHPAAQAILAKKRMKCPECAGRKTREVVHDLFVTDHRIDFVAGAVFDGVELGLPMVKYVIPSYHPSRIMVKAETKAQKASTGQFLFSPALAHFQKAARLLERDRSWNFGHKVIEQGPDQAFELKRWLDARYVTAPEGYYGPDYTTVDLETDDKEPAAVTDIRCVGLGPVYVSNPQGDACHPIVVDTEGLPKDHPTVRLLCNWMRDPRIKKAGQNAILYDTQVLFLHWGVECQGFSEDTLYAHMSVAPDEKHDLQHIALTYTDSPAWKPPKNKNGHQVWESKAQLHLYNARDVYNTSLSLEGLRREMAAEQSDFVYRLDIAKAHVARGMDRAGLPVHPETYEALRKEAVTQKPVWLEKLREQVKDSAFNPNAPVQLAKVLFGPGSFCGLKPTVFSKKTGAPSTRAEALFPFRKHPFVSDLLEFRKWRGICSNYFGSPPDDLYEEDEDGESNAEDWVQVKGIKVWDDWRIRCRWNPIGAKTGRWSSSPNLMNWPEEMRRIISTMRITTARGVRRVLVGADMPQAELRVIAALSGDDKLTELCINSDEARKFDPAYDPHSYVGSIAFPNFLEVPEWASKIDKDTGVEKKFSPRKGLRDACKCVHPDTLVWDGSISLRSLAEVMPVRGPAGPTEGTVHGLSVMDGSRGCVDVSAWCDTGEKPSVHVLTRGGLLTCSKDHRLLLADRVTQCRAEDLEPGMALAVSEIPRLRNRAYPVIKIPGGVFRGIPAIQVQTSDDWAYLAGAFLGDGTISGSGVALCHGSVDKTDVAHDMSYAEWQGVLAQACRAVGFDPLLRNTSVSLGNRSAARVLSALGLTTHTLAVGSADSDTTGQRVLRVPVWVREAGADAAAYFLAGLSDTDGTVTRGAIRICTKDPVFAGQLATLCAGLYGVEHVFVEASWNKTYKRFYYRVGLTRDASSQLALRMRHRGKSSKISPNVHQRTGRDRLFVVDKVIDAGMQPSVDLQVDTDQHVFLQNNFIGSNSVIYGLNYGAGAAKVLETISTDPRYDGPTLSLDMVERIIAAIYTAFPSVRRYREKVIDLSSQTGYVRDALINRRRVFPLREVPPTEASNYAIQATVASMMDMTIIELAHFLPQVDPTAFIVAQVHDAVYIECDEDKAPMVCHLIAESMSQEIRLVSGAMKMPFPVTAKSHTDWAALG